MPNLPDVYKLHCSGTALSVLHSAVGFTKDPEIWGLLKKQCVVSDSPIAEGCELRYMTIIRGSKNNRVLHRTTDESTGAGNCSFITHVLPSDKAASFMDMLFLNTYKAYRDAIPANDLNQGFNSLLANSSPIPLGYLYDGERNYIVTELVIDDEVFNICYNPHTSLNYAKGVKPIQLERYIPSTELEKFMWKEIAITK